MRKTILAFYPCYPCHPWLKSSGRHRMAASDLVVALTGASGAPYGVRLLEVLLRAGRTVHLSVSPAAVQVIDKELDRKVRLDRFDPADPFASADVPVERLHYHDYRDFMAGIASG